MAPQEVDDRVQAFLAELSKENEPPWQDAGPGVTVPGKTTSSDKEKNNDRTA
jgi:hypothetical protein